MQYKLNFDDKINAELISKIEQRAAGGSIHKALQIMVIEWNALERVGKRPKNDLIGAEIQPNEQNLDTQIEAASSSINEAW